VGVLDTRKVDRGREGVRSTKKDEEHWLRSCQRIRYSLRYYVAFLNPLKAGAPLVFNNSVRTSKRTPRFSITKINWLILFKEIIAVRSRRILNPYIQNAALLTINADGT
jgi:hypothetical protein